MEGETGRAACAAGLALAVALAVARTQRDIREARADDLDNVFSESFVHATP